MEENKNSVEIIEEQPTEEVKIDISALAEPEQKMAEAHGIVKKEEAAEDKQPDKKDIKDEKASFEAIEKDEKNLLGNYNKNEQALYWKWKHDKKERQQAQAERDLALVREKDLKQQLAKASEEGTLTVGKLKKIETLLSGKAEDITVEALQEILKEQPAKEDKNKPVTVADLERMQEEAKSKKSEDEKTQEKLVNRIKELEEYGKTQYDNYDEIVDSAKAVLDGKIDVPITIDLKHLSTRLVEKVQTAEPDEVSEFILGIAKLNPDFGKKKSETAKPASSQEIDKIIKNAAKTTSAAVNGGGGKRVVSYDDLTVEDAAKLSPDQWRTLPDNVRKRLLK